VKAKDLHNIPDVQAAHDSRKLAIDQVGVKAIRHPVRIMERPSAERGKPTSACRTSSRARTCRASSRS
jgi:GTP cyclohydrolase FolE2